MNPRIWTPAPLALGNATLFAGSEIEAYEHDILGNPNATEHEASHFFQKCPKFLHMGVGAEVRREVVLVGSSERVDFFRRSCGESYWDIIELKHPKKRLIADANTLHPRLSADVDKAINQAMDYRDLIDSKGEVRADLKRRGIAVCRPQMLIVVGQQGADVDPELLRILYDRVRQRGAVQLYSYTDIYHFAKENYQKTGVILVPAFHLTDEASRFPNEILTRMVDLVAADPQSLYKLSPRDFGRLVAHLMESFGFNVEQTDSTRDGGADIIAIREGIGTSKFLVECKRYAEDRKVGISVVRAVYGSVMHEGATKGMIVTTGKFSPEARQFLEQCKWLLEGCDFDSIIQWIQRYKNHERGGEL